MFIDNYCPTYLDIKGDDVEDAKEASEIEDIEDEEGGEEEEEEEDELLQDTDPGPLGCDGKDVEDVLNIISQSIYREGDGIFFIHSSSFIDRYYLISINQTDDAKPISFKSCRPAFT